MQAAIERVGRQVGSAEIPTPDAAVKATGWDSGWVAAAATLALAAAIGAAMVWPRGPQRYATEGTGTQFTLPDDSRVEMRAHSELAVDRSDEGFRIRLLKGGIIVDAAEQRNGRLYVETKDVTVSVVGTVFVVDADETGSRVAVIEGEVRVQLVGTALSRSGRQGGTEKTLLPGEQLATNALLPPPPVREAIAWSLNAPALVALLGQAEVVPPALEVQNSAAAPQREAFEVASIRPTRFAPGGERGAGGGPSSPRPAGEPCGSTGSGFLQWDPKRVAISDMTLYGLVAWAYELPCRPWNGSHVLTGGPGWVRSDGYDIEALFPDGPPAYTSTQITQLGKTFTRYTMGPRFRALLRTLLEDRFGLVLRRETREVPVYVLTVAPDGHKLALWKEGDPATPNEFMAQRARNGTLLAEETLSLIGMTAAEVNEMFMKTPVQLEALTFRTYREKGIRPLYTLMDVKTSMASLAEMLSRSFDNANWRPVLDRTNLTGQFNYFVRYDRSPAPDAMGPSIFSALEKELGLRLQPTTAPMEVFVIDRAERPSEN
jgi:uncharacterized protein (TIGR03435 family)